MVFSSITFLFNFLPIVMILYFIVPVKLKNSILLLASLVFYGWGEPQYILLVIISILFNYIMGLLIERSAERSLAKLWMILSVILGLAVLGYFKYSAFFIENINKITGTSYTFQSIALPIGISFYTFQILSYTVDVYYKRVSAQKNLIHFATYVVLFPQLIAGPIVRYVDIATALKTRKHTIENCRCGVRRFLFGLAKKVIIANSLGELCDIFVKTDEKTVMFYWIYAIAFTLQIYFDFSGYSDMAIGLGKILGFDFLENFKYPYSSKSITEFWRRWHISLGTWFRDYVYIPMGGNRVSKPRCLINILVVWSLTGLWHGAEWNFVVWGFMFAILLIIEKMWLGKFIGHWPKIVSHTYVMFFVVISFVIFNASGMSEAMERLRGMFGMKDIPISGVQTFYYMRSYAVMFIIAIIGCTPLSRGCVERIQKTSIGPVFLNIIEPIVCIGLLLVITGYLVDGSFNPFLYFRF